MNIKNKITILLFQFLIFLYSCELKKDLDIELVKFPPKLSITAILDHEQQWLDISLMEGHSLANYAYSYTFDKENIRYGEIRLFEDGILIRSISGEFDMSSDFRTRRNGYRHIATGIITKPGSVYRLEADVMGYPMATSTAVMPVAPVITASMDTSVQAVKKKIREIYALGNGLWYEKLTDRYWPVTLHVTDPEPGVVNYFALDILKHESYFTGNTQTRYTSYNWGVGVSDVSVLLETDMEELLVGTESFDLYLFSMLMMNDLSFSGQNSLPSFYARVAEIPNDQMNDDSHFEDDPNIEKITTHHRLSLRVTHLPPEVFRYYRSLIRNQSQNFFREPVSIASNIENGYGVFSVLNSARVTLHEWDTYEYRKKGE